MEVRNYGEKGEIIITGKSFEHKQRFNDWNCKFRDNLNVDGKITKGWLCPVGVVKDVKKFVEKNGGIIIDNPKYDFELHDIKKASPVFIHQYLYSRLESEQISTKTGERGYLQNRLLMLQDMAIKRCINNALASIIDTDEFAATAITTDRSIGEFLNYYGVPAIVIDIDRLTAEVIITAFELAEKNPKKGQKINPEYAKLIIDLEPRLTKFINEE